jgi:membrane-associated phospholipid phosphatase
MVTPVAVVGYGAFLLLTLAVHLHLAYPIDLAIARAVPAVWSEPLDLWAGALAVAFSTESMFFVAGAAAVLLGRAGAGTWSLVPFAFLALACVELTMKLAVDQPPLLPEYLRTVVDYPLTHVQLPHSFPSGHAMRISFMCLFGAGLLYHRWPARRRMILALAILEAVVLGQSRLYFGQHWFSDIVGGLLLGGTTGFLMVTGVRSRIAAHGRVTADRLVP